MLLELIGHSSCLLLEGVRGDSEEDDLDASERLFDGSGVPAASLEVFRAGIAGLEDFDTSSARIFTSSATALVLACPEGKIPDKIKPGG